jgi:guanine deaminase
VVLDGRDLLVVPGFRNAHTHSPETLARGLADGRPWPTWMEAVWSRMDGLDDESLHAAVVLAAAEMLHGGVTAVVDHFRQTPMRSDVVDVVARAWLQTGMRVCLAPMVRDEAVPAWVKEPIGSYRQQLDTILEALQRWHGTDGRLQLAIGPSAPTRCSDDLLRSAASMCAEHDVAMHMHLDETREEAELARSRFGSSAVGHLHRLGLLGPHLSLAHCVWCGDADIDLLARTHTVVVHNPASNLRLGSGRAPVERMLARGVDVVLGTDGAASNDSQSVLETVKYAALLPRLVVEDPGDWITARQALAMASNAAGRIRGLARAGLGRGANADFAAFDRSVLPLSPVNDHHCQLAFAGAGMRARHVVVAGRLVLEDHVIRTFDEAEWIATARKIGIPAA